MTDTPARIGRYEVLSLLGQGGMGVLYLARDPVIDRHVALKLLKVDNDDLRRRFVREARSAGRLQHPNIVTVYDVGDHDGELFIAMEYIDGDTLATLIREDAPFSTLRKLEMLDQLADGLGFAHHRSIVHRDIKPANLMVTRGGLLKVLDFGIARITRRDAVASLAGGALMGTPAYMAPEQLEGGEVDHRADIFAVGLVMYELLSGRRAFVGPTTADVLERVLRSEPTALETLVPGIDADLARCVRRAIAKRPDDRYQDLQDLRNDLGRVRRRAELESGSFDATVVVQVPASLRPPTAPVTTVPGVMADPPTAPATGAPAIAGASSSSTGAGAGTQTEPGAPAEWLADEGDVLRHLAAASTRGSRPIAVPENVDETIVAPLYEPGAAPVTPAHGLIAAAGLGVPPVVPPPLPASGGATAPAPAPAAGAASPPPVAREGALASPPPSTGVPPPGRRSLLPALLAVGAIVLVLALGAIAGLWWLKNLLLDRLTPAQTVAEATVETPGASDAPPVDRIDLPAATTEQAIEVPPIVPAEEPTPPVVIPLPVDPPPSQPTVVPSSRPADPRPVEPSVVPSRRAAPRQPDVVPAQPASRSDTPNVATPTVPPAADRTDDPPAPPPSRVEEVPADDEALSLVRAYVAARNTGHAAGLRRVWPTVSDADVRRMTGEFSAPLTLTACQVDAADGGRMRATCQFTQPGSTGFSQGTALTIRRQLVFAMERRGRNWVIADVAG